MPTISRVFAYLKRYPFLATGTMFCAIVSTLTVIIFPAVTQRIVDIVVSGGHPDMLIYPILIGLASFVAQNGLNAARICLNNFFEQNVIFDIRSDLYSHLQTLPLKWFDHRATGDIMTRVVEDVTSMERMLIDGIEQGVVAVLQIFIVAAFMFWKDPTLALIALAPTPLLALGAMGYTLTARGRYQKVRSAASALNSLLQDNLAGVRQIKTYASETREHERFNSTSDKLRKATLRVMGVWALYNPGMTFIASCGALFVIGYGSYQALHGRIEVGVLFAFALLIRLLYDPIERLHQLNQMFQSGRAASERVFEIMDAGAEAGHLEESTKTEQPLIRGEVVFENVGFSYSDEATTLQSISFHAKPGEEIALVGPTGAGKSSLVALLTRFYEFNSGRILIDGRDLRDYPLRQLRESIAMVTQESFIFNGTTAENLLVGKPGATEAEMWEALEAANAADFVRRLPEGLHTQVGEKGIRLSVGERQRMSIARALLKNPPILILDEATASVDNTTERLIQEALDRLLAHRTSFVIAHRLSTILKADQILVLERGTIVERGRHHELVEAGGLYSRLSQQSFLSPTAHLA